MEIKYLKFKNLKHKMLNSKKIKSKIFRKKPVIFKNLKIIFIIFY